jgi:hypothetical protein
MRKSRAQGALAKDKACGVPQFIELKYNDFYKTECKM